MIALAGARAKSCRISHAASRVIRNSLRILLVAICAIPGTADLAGAWEAGGGWVSGEAEWRAGDDSSSAKRAALAEGLSGRSPKNIPENDDYTSPNALTGLPVAVVGSNVEATLEPDEPLPGPWVGYADASVWYRWTAPTSGPVRIDTLGSDFDTLLAVWTGEELDELVLLACNDQYDDTNQSGVFIDAEIGDIYQIAVYSWGDETGAVALQIAEDQTSRISGTVTGPSGADALPGIRTRAYRWNESWGSWNLLGEAYTDADGDYVVRGLPAGAYRVEFADQAGDYLEEFYDNALDLESGVDVVVPAESTATGIDASLAVASKIAGSVTGAGGSRPLEGVDVALFEWHEANGRWVVTAESETDLDGRYAIGGLEAGTYRVRFTDWDGDYVQEFFDNASNVLSGTDIVVPVETTIDGIDAALAGAVVSGTVTGPDGAMPLQGILATAYRWNEAWAGWEWMGQKDTEADGSYAIEGLPGGTYRLQFADALGDYLPEAYDDAANMESGTDVVVMAQASVGGIDASLGIASKIAGAVTGPDGHTPLESMEVAAYCWNELWETWEWAGQVATGADGAYAIGGLSAGTYRVRFADGNGDYLGEVYDNASDLESGTDIVVPAETTVADIDASLGNASKIAGTVAGPGGVLPLADIEATAFCWSDSLETWEWMGTEQTAADGRYVINGLAPGTYRVQFTDWTGEYTQEAYEGAPDLDSGTDIEVPVEETVTGIDAWLARAWPADPPVIVGITRSETNAAMFFVGAGGEEYVVQKTTSLTNPWSDAGPPVLCLQGTNAVLLPPLAPATFWRLTTSP